MEIGLQNITSPAILSLFLFLFMVLSIVWRSKTKPSNSQLPPGPPNLPLIWNRLLLGAMPHHGLANLAKRYGPLMHIKLGGLSTIVVSSPEIAREVFRTHDIIFANRPHVLAADIVTYGSKGMTFSPYGSHWRQMRKICTFELLNPKRVESFQSIREEEASNIVKEICLSEGSSINLTEMINSWSYGLTSRVAFKGKSKDQEAFIKVMREVSKAVAGFSIADLYPSIKLLQVLTGIKSKAEKLHREIDKVLEKIVRDHRDTSSKTKAINEKEGEDILDVLLKLQIQNNLEHPLSDNVIKATILDIYAAGSGTSSKALQWAMSELVKNPRVMESAQAEVRRAFDGKGHVDEANLHELKYLKSVIKETLRLHIPAPLLLPRECTERCEINGYEIPAKSKVIINAWAMARDPNYWIEPEKFYPERFLDSSVDYKGADLQFIPFGSGRRMCPGITFGTVNIELLLANLLFHFDWKMPNGKKPEELDMTESFGLSVTRKHDLYLIPTTYHSSAN